MEFQNLLHGWLIYRATDEQVRLDILVEPARREVGGPNERTNLIAPASDLDLWLKIANPAIACRIGPVHTAFALWRLMQSLDETQVRELEIHAREES